MAKVTENEKKRVNELVSKALDGAGLDQKEINELQSILKKASEQQKKETEKARKENSEEVTPENLQKKFEELGKKIEGLKASSEPTVKEIYEEHVRKYGNSLDRVQEFGKHELEQTQEDKEFYENYMKQISDMNY